MGLVSSELAAKLNGMLTLTTPAALYNDLVQPYAKMASLMQSAYMGSIRSNIGFALEPFGIGKSLDQTRCLLSVAGEPSWMKALKGAGAGGAPCIERRQQHAALQHELLRKARVCQAREEALVHVQLERLLRGASIGAREPLQSLVGLLWTACAHASIVSSASAIAFPVRSSRANARSSPVRASRPSR